MKKSIKRLTIALALMIITTCLTSGGNAYFFNDPLADNYYQPKLVLDLRCNGDTLDYSGYQNNGVPIFETQYVTSINDRGLNFSGANFVEINDSASLNFGAGNFSVACWFKTTSYQTNVIIDKRDISHNYQGYCLCLLNGIPLLQMGDGSAYYSFWPGYSAPAYNDGQWHYLGGCVSRNSSAVTVTLYVDGAKVHQGSNGQVGSISNNTKLYVGRNVDGSGNFNGSLDDISIFNVALTNPCYHSTDNELQICRYNLFTSTDLDLTFDNTTSDSSRYQNTITYFGSGPSYVAGMNQNAISFGGSQYIKVNNSPSINFGTGDFTVSCWFKTNSTQLTNTIIDKRNNVYQGYLLCLYNGSPLMQIGDQSGYYNFGSSNGPAFNNNQWHFITVTVDRDSPTGLKMYIDGSLILTGNPTVKPGSLTNTVDLLVGKHMSGMYFQGCLDEVYLINRALPGNMAEEYNPIPPTLVSAEAGDGRVTLLWNTVVGAATYQVKRSTTGTGNFTTIASGLTGTTYTDANLTNGTTYYYEVTAVNPGGESAPSAVKAATPLGAVYPWTEKAKLPTKRYSVRAVTINSKIYALSGNCCSDTDFKVYEYNSDIDAWTEKTALPVNRTSTGVVAFNNKIYIIGGDTRGTSNCVTTMEEYNPVTGSVVAKASMLTARRNPGVAVVNNRIYAIGGCNNCGALTVTEEYDPSDTSNGYDTNGNPMGKWISKASFATVREAFGTAMVNGKIYIIGGANINILNTVEEFDPVANSWAYKAVLPTTRAGMGAVTVGNRIYAIGGTTDGTTYSNFVEEYDPGTNSWASKPTIINTRINCGVAELNGSIYIIGGQGGLLCWDSILNSVERYMPTPLTALSNTSQIVLTWYTVGGAQSYTVKRASDPGGTYSVIASNLTATTYTDTGLIMGKPYYYMVYAVKDGVEITVSNEAWALLGLTTPTNFTAVRDTDHFDLSWNGVSKASGYYVRDSLTPGGPYTGDFLKTTFTEFKATGGTWYLVVSATNADGESPNSQEIIVVF